MTIRIEPESWNELTESIYYEIPNTEDEDTEFGKWLIAKNILTQEQVDNLEYEEAEKIYDKYFDEFIAEMTVKYEDKAIEQYEDELEYEENLRDTEEETIRWINGR